MYSPRHSKFNLLLNLLLVLTSALYYSSSPPIVAEEINSHPDSNKAFSKIVPIFDCKPSAEDGTGKASIKPVKGVQAGSIHSFEITYTAEKSGIKPGGFIILQVSPWWGWSRPQTVSAEALGYTLVTPSFKDPSFKVQALNFHRVIAFSRMRSIKAGESITFRYGPVRVDRFAEKEELFQIFVDGDGDGHYAEIKNSPQLKILPHPATKLTVNVPPRVQPKQTIKINVAPIDAGNNWSTLPVGKYKATLSPADSNSVRSSIVKEIASGERRSLQLALETSPEEGVFVVQVTGPNQISGTSNTLLSQKGVPKLQLYFGDIHGHTRLSDGTGTPEDYYAYAREVSKLDIAAVTDHADHGTINIRGPVWDRIQKATIAAYRPKEFVTLFSFEWTNWKYGHRNVYYLKEKGPVYRAFDKGSDTPEDLWKLLEPYEAMTIPHHVGGGPVPTDWSVVPHPMERLVEISSIHGASEYYGGEMSIYRPVRGAFVRDALKRGYRLGIIGSGDTHDGHPGTRSPGSRVSGLLGLFAKELTREAVWAALKRRQVFGTSGPKIQLYFRAGDSPMGSEIEWPAKKDLPIAIMAVGSDAIAAVEIIKNGETVFRKEGNGRFLQVLTADTEISKGTSWYYARIIQKDGQMAWSSPIWVTREKA